jgi:hypothetical protein
MSRPTPFDLIFGDFAEELAAIGAASAGPGGALDDLHGFAGIPDVQRLLQRIEVPELMERAPEAASEYVALVYAAARFAAAGQLVLEISRARLEPALEQMPPPNAPAVPGTACYLQLPPHWVWAQATEGGPHEPLEGMFVVRSHRGDVTTVVAILGLRAERGGFTQVSVRASSAEFTAARTLRRNPPFAPAMDAGAARGYRSVVNPAELLTLTHLALLAGET